MGHVHEHVAGLAAGHTPERRDMADLLRSRAHLLCGNDRSLVQMYLEHGNSFRQIACLAGVAPCTVGRRIRRIVRRLEDETYPLCLAGRDDFTGREMALIKDYFVRGLMMTRISREHGVSYHHVRRTVRKARKYVRSLQELQPQGHHPATFATSACKPASNGAYDDNL